MGRHAEGALQVGRRGEPLPDDEVGDVVEAARLQVDQASAGEADAPEIAGGEPLAGRVLATTAPASSRRTPLTLVPPTSKPSLGRAMPAFPALGEALLAGRVEEVGLAHVHHQGQALADLRLLAARCPSFR